MTWASTARAATGERCRRPTRARMGGAGLAGLQQCETVRELAGAGFSPGGNRPSPRPHTALKEGHGAEGMEATTQWSVTRGAELHGKRGGGGRCL
jgi:hypothetical protein